MWRDCVTVALALSAYLGYYHWADPIDRAWVSYITCAALTLWLAWDRPGRRTWLRFFAAVYITFEALQQIGCGLLEFGTVPDGQDICIRVVGEEVYRAAMSIVLATLITGAFKWQNRRSAN